jgi:plastocyanin
MKFAIRISSALATASIAVLAAAGCGGAKDTSNDPLTVGGMTETVTMTDNTYQPGNLQVPVGAAVTFRNEDGALHDAKAKDGGFETGDLNKGDTETIVLSEIGEYRYYCEFHPSMKAKITVVDVSDAVPPD